MPLGKDVNIASGGQIPQSYYKNGSAYAHLPCIVARYAKPISPGPPRRGPRDGSGGPSAEEKFFFGEVKYTFRFK